MPEEVAAELGDFFREKSATAIAAFASDLVDALFKGVPESANSKEIPAKTKVPRGARTRCKTHDRELSMAHLLVPMSQVEEQQRFGSCACC